MTKQELQLILESGEGYTVEFKENINTDLSKEMVAFANASGGHIFIGINDDNDITGTATDNFAVSRIQNSASSCDPLVPIDIEIFGNLICIHVAEGANKPYRCNKGFFVRRGANSEKLSTREITEFIQIEGKVLFDERIREDLHFEKYFDASLLEGFLEKTGIKSRLDTKSMLSNLSVLKYKNEVPYLNNAGVLFFCKSPDPELYHCNVSCALFKGKERLTILDKKDFFDDLVSNI